MTSGYTKTDLLGFHCIALRNAIQLLETSGLHHPSFGKALFIQDSLSRCSHIYEGFRLFESFNDYNPSYLQVGSIR